MTPTVQTRKIVRYNIVYIRVYILYLGKPM